MLTTGAAHASPAGLSPVAVVWCRQVDNEAESPGYTTIPEEFPGRRETLEAIRVIGNLTVNVADTHDYWDPEPGQPLSYYPNIFLYPAANGRYTCIGRMFLSTEDRPRLGMKTLVFSTADLIATGEFGPAVLRAHASMGGKAAPPRVTAEPDAAVYQAIGEGFLFHRGTTEPVVVVASDQWESACQVVLNLIRVLPTSLVALGAFLVFPYFLPEAKVNPHEFTEQVPLALAVMRVPRAEAQGERHAKRLEAWESAPVVLRDLTRPASGRGRDNLPLVLQYVRDHADAKIAEVAQRVDAVEGDRTRSEIHDAERQGGRDRRKEMWRIGTAMETAALLLTRPKGRSVPMTGEAVKRANEYLQAQPSTPLARAVDAPLPTSPPLDTGPTGPSPTQHPPWLQRGVDIELPAAGAVAVPLSVSDDNSIRAAPPPDPLASKPGTVPISDAELEARIRRIVDARFATLPLTAPSDPNEASQREARLLAAMDARVRDATDRASQDLLGVQTDLSSRLAAVEARPIVDPSVVSAESERQLHAQFDPILVDLPAKNQQAIQASTEAWSERMREELRNSIADVKASVAHSEDELRLALAAQLEVELAETKEQGTALREQIEARVRELLSERTAEIEQRRAKELRELEQRLGILVDGRTKDLEGRVRAALAEQQTRTVAALEERRTADLRELEQRFGTVVDTRAKDVETRLRAAVADQQARTLAALDERRAKDMRELEQRFGILVDGRTKDLDTRLRVALAEQPARMAMAIDERVALSEKRLGVEREARLAELADAQTQALAGLQVRLQAYVEQKLHENQDREREKYVELLARLRTEVDQAISKSVDPGRLDIAIRERLVPALETLRESQELATGKSIAEAETRIRASVDDTVVRLESIESRIEQREADLGRIEHGVRADIDDLDRRIQVMSDRMIPLLRRTWMKVGDLEKGAPVNEEAEVRFKELRRDLLREVRRIEGEMRDQTDALRDRLEGTIAHQGRIWLNLLKQLSAETEELGSDLLSGPRPASRSARSAPAHDDFLTSDLGTPVAFAPVEDDPPNPMAPDAPAEDPARDSRRRTRRS